jgi:hypothetical protein
VNQLSDIKIPTIHMNGTSYQDLYDGHMAMRQSLMDAARTLRANTPNMRDFYVQSDEAGQEARHQHAERLAVIDRMAEEIEFIVLGIMAQKRER